ncbi:MAG TPA: hypothetical protein VHX61_09540 [Rhizomicrobium sp.]|nr:hypothetical protein [Rhizomicrobium sp.]
MGAVIDLGECLDLLSKVAIDMVRAVHLSLVDMLKKAGKPPAVQ